MDSKLKMAYLFALDKHRGQVRKDGSPYINHPIKVVELLDYFYTNYVNINYLKCAGYLHDTLEDTNTSLKEISDIFGDYVAYLVKGVTNNELLKKLFGKTNYLCMKLINMDEDVLDLKLCDRLANVIDLRNSNVKFNNKYSLETSIIINYLVNNRKLDDTQYKIVKNINDVLNDYKTRKLFVYK